MWLLSFALLAVTSHGRPDGPKLLITIDLHRDLDLARTAPLPPADRTGPTHRTDAKTRNSRFVPEPSVAHQSATAPSTPDPNHLKHKTSITNARKLSSDPAADGASATDQYQTGVGNELEIAASAPPASPTSPVPIQPAATAKTAPAPAPDPQADLPYQQRPPPRPPATGPPEHRAVANPKAPRSGGHATGHSLPHSAVATTTVHPADCPPPPRRDAVRSARAATDSALAHRSDRAREHGPRPSVPPAQALPPADATDVPLHTKPGTLASQHP